MLVISLELVQSFWILCYIHLLSHHSVLMYSCICQLVNKWICYIMLPWTVLECASFTFYNAPRIPCQGTHSRWLQDQAFCMSWMISSANQISSGSVEFCPVSIPYGYSTAIFTGVLFYFSHYWSNSHDQMSSCRQMWNNMWPKYFSHEPTTYSYAWLTLWSTSSYVMWFPL